MDAGQAELETFPENLFFFSLMAFRLSCSYRESSGFCFVSETMAAPWNSGWPRTQHGRTLGLELLVIFLPLYLLVLRFCFCLFVWVSFFGWFLEMGAHLCSPG